jgi:serine/threonine protein kinase
MNPSTPTIGHSPSVDAGLAELVEELTARLKAGESIDLNAFLEDRAEYAAALRDLYPALRLLADCSRPASVPPSGDDPPADEAPPGELGDFRILREIGRGGMGVVYEAEQISLRRRVALKVLPFAATMDPRGLQRFQNEARAAASLHHTNIVPVFAVGCERGVHYYAMQIIEGRTLARVIEERRHLKQKKSPAPKPDPAKGDATVPYAPSPALPPADATTAPRAAISTEGTLRDPDYFRLVARLGVQAAEALDHAHQVGVVHRDVKPSNLLIDAAGTIWIMDFGLAQLQTEGTLTLTGDLVGTVRYMSPEQALAKRVPIDHRTDVYSLGATLYELLTLRPVFTGEGRQDLLRQIAFDEPERPRRVNRAIPTELETILLKALEKNPKDRYGTAQEMADDLRRYLEDRPIQARRPSWGKVAAKWARRHRTMVWATAVVLLVSALVGGSVWIWREQQCFVAQGETEAALSNAGQLQKQGRLPEALLALRRAEPLRSAGLLSESLALRIRKRQTDLEMLVRLEDERLKQGDQ